MHNSEPLGTIEPTIRTAKNTADSPIPCTENEARKKLQQVIKDKYQVKVKVNEIKHNHLSIFFDHENGGKYYLKTQYHGNDAGITDYISQNMRNFSFLI